MSYYLDGNFFFRPCPSGGCNLGHGGRRSQLSRKLSPRVTRGLIRIYRQENVYQEVWGHRLTILGSEVMPTVSRNGHSTSVSCSSSHVWAYACHVHTHHIWSLNTYTRHPTSLPAAHRSPKADPSMCCAYETPGISWGEVLNCRVTTQCWWGSRKVSSTIVMLYLIGEGPWMTESNARFHSYHGINVLWDVTFLLWTSVSLSVN